MKSNIIDLPELREQTDVFENRTHAGHILAQMIDAADTQDAIILGIPAGGVPVGAAMAEKLGIDFDVAVVSKITLPWNTEAGYGAVAFDGTVKLNKDMVRRVSLTETDIKNGIEKTNHNNRTEHFKALETKTHKNSLVIGTSEPRVF